MYRAFNNQKGFTLIELVIVIVILGILAAVGIPQFLDLRDEAEEASVNHMIGSLESALSIYASKQYVNGNTITVVNPFDQLSNIPNNYNGINDPVNPTNTPSGTWSWRISGNWVMYHPKKPINGGWLSNGVRFIIYQVQPVVDGTDTVGIRLTPTPTYAYTWN